MRRVLILSVALALTVPFGPTALAQPPAPGQMPPEMQAKMKAWQKWRTSHRNISALQQTMNGIQMLERDKATRLSKAQAKTLLSVLHTWRPKKAMSDPQAKAVNKQLTGMLTTSQLKRLTRARPGGGLPGGGLPGGGPGGGPGGPPPGGGMGGPPPDGGPGGPPPAGFGGPPPGGARPDRPAMNPGGFPSPKEFNPLNPDTLPFVRARTMEKQRLDDLTIALKMRVK